MRYGLVLLSLLLGCATSRPAERKPVPGFDAELTQVAYPFKVRTFRLSSQQQQLRFVYMDETPTSWNGRTVLLLHGKNFSGAYWEPTMRALLGRGFRVVVPDQIGFGKSSKPAAYQFSFAQLAQNTAQLLDSVGVEKVIVVGHSMGGMLATRFTLQYPTRVERLALVNPIGLEDYGALVPYRSVDALYQDELRQTPDTLRAYQRQNYYAGNWNDAYEKQLAPQAGWTLHPDYPRVAWNAALTAEMILTQPVVHDFPRIAVPTLLIIGQRDRTALGRGWAPPEVGKAMGDYPQLGRRTAAAIPGSELVEIPGVGHLPQVEAFDRYFEALGGFLAQ